MESKMMNVHKEYFKTGKDHYVTSLCNSRPESIKILDDQINKIPK